MKNQNITFQQFIEKLKTIDVGELLDKAKTIKVEDIKSLKFSDLKEITKSNYFYPTLGIIFAALSLILFFLPSLESLKDKQSKSQQYNSENQELPLIDEELVQRRKAKKLFNLISKDITGLVPRKGDLVLIPEILNDSSKRSGAEIVEFAPIPLDELNSCRSLPEEDTFNNSFDDNFASENFEDNTDLPMDDINNIEEFPLVMNESKLKVNDFFISETDGTKEFESIKENISDIFQSNYFVINIRSNYLDSLKFLKYLQEYKIAILPYCFEPRMRSNGFNSEQESNSSQIGEIDARIIINVPIYKEK